MSDVLKERRAGERRCEKVREKLAAAYAEVERLRVEIRTLPSQGAWSEAARIFWLREADQARRKAEAEVARLRAAVSFDPWDAWKNAEAEVERLRRALEDISVVSGANYPGVLARAALRGEGEK